MRRYRAASSVVAVRRRHRSTKDVLYLDGSIATATHRGGKDVKSGTCWLLLADRPHAVYTPSRKLYYGHCTSRYYVYLTTIMRIASA